eukprot:6659274-Prymnesium_polylepis.1
MPHHFSRLQHVAPRPIEECKVKRERQVIVAHVQRHGMAPRQPPWQGAHIFPGKSKPAESHKRGDEPSAR